MTKQKIGALVADMSTAEKILQLTQLNTMFYSTDGGSGTATGPFLQKELSDAELFSAGSILSDAGAEKLIALQKLYMEKNPHHIPFLFMTDIIHGFRTVFPIPLALGCAFDETFAEEMARVSALEGAVSGLHVTFSPMADLVRDARWGRVMESCGEDPLLNARYAGAMVRGYQGENAADFGRLGACVKHFAAYGASEAGRDYNTVDVSEGVLREYYLGAYKAAIDAGALLVMTSFNTVFRVPASANSWLLRDLLRDEWGFSGVIISDHTAVSEVINHGIAQDSNEAALRCFSAGVDIEMMSLNFYESIEKLIESGEIDVKKLDEAVYRVLKLKNTLGLFENPYKDADPALEKTYILCDEHRKSARKIAAASAVLLKNEVDVLPLENGSIPALVGPFAASKEVLGGWSIFGRHEDCVSLYEGIAGKLNGAGNKNEAAFPEPPQWAESEDAVNRALEFCCNKETVIVCIGEGEDDSGEAKSKARPEVSSFQEELVKRLYAQGKRVITIVFAGRPLLLENIASHSDALIMAWFLGVESGNALADLLYGSSLFQGRLSISFPRCTGQIPLYYNHFNTGRPAKTGNGKLEPFRSGYLDVPNAPLYPFGYGLSYSRCTYSAVTLSTSEIKRSENLTASVKITNTGKLPMLETVQLYIRDITASVARPVKELKAYTKVDLCAGQMREISFTITDEMLAFTSFQNKRVLEDGRFIVFIGEDSDTENCAEFVLK